MHFHNQLVDTNNQSHLIIMYTAEQTNHNHNSQLEHSIPCAEYSHNRSSLIYVRIISVQYVR